MISALFKDRESLERAYRVVSERGYSSYDITIIISDETRKQHFADDGRETELGNKALEGAGIGTSIGGTTGAVLSAIAAIGTSMVLPGMGLVVAGPLLAGLAGAGGATGGLMGALVGAGLPEEHARKYEEGLRQGAILINISPRNEEDAAFFEHEWKSHNGEAIWRDIREDAASSTSKTDSSEVAEASTGIREAGDVAARGTTRGQREKPGDIAEGRRYESRGAKRRISMEDEPPEGAEQESESTYHLGAEMEGEVLVERVVTVAVTLSRELIGLTTSAAAKESKFTVDAQRKLIIQVMPKENFETVNEDRIEIDPQTLNETKLFYFDLKPTSVGDGMVWVIARQGGESLALLKLEPKIVAVKTGGNKRVQDTQSSPEINTLSAPVDTLRIYERKDGDEIWYTYDLDFPSLLDPDKDFGTFDSKRLQGDRQQYVKALYRKIEKRWLSKKSDVQAFTRELRTYGGQLFDELFPLELQAILWEHRKNIKRINVVSAEPFIPWELVHLKEPGEGLPDEKSETRFLGQMGLIRWLHEAGRAPLQVKMRNGRARYVIPEYPLQQIRLPEAEQERAFLEKTFSATAVEPNQNEVYNVISKPGEFDLLHFACHGSAENSNISDASLMLQGRMETVSVNDGVTEEYIEDIFEASFAGENSRLRADDNRPMVVLNACQTARGGYSLTGIGGFAQAFLKRGAGIFVGTLWAVGDSPARTFTETLYRQLYQEGAMLADAVIAAREAARQAGDATWLAYAVYGHPNMKFSK